MPKILITRFSALGDVAMLASVIPEFMMQHPQVEIILLSRKPYKPLFFKHPNLTFIGVDFEHEYRGIWGLRRLAQDIKKLQPTHYADCHNVIRTQVLSRLLKIKKTAVLDKGRKEKAELTRRKNKKIRPLESMHERFADVFRKLGFPLELSHKLPQFKVEKTGIGIAPFAQYKEKMLPLETTQEVVIRLAEMGKEVMLFGGGTLEKEILAEWETLHPNIVSLAGKFDFGEELNIIKCLELMISMDSANMHLASLVGTRVISVWGATHPFLGFLGYGQQISDCVQENIFCRPCSVYGRKTCYRKNLECLKLITSEMIIEKVISS